MLYAGLDLSRKRVDVHVLDGEGATIAQTTARPDREGLSCSWSGLRRWVRFGRRWSR